MTGIILMGAGTLILGGAAVMVWLSIPREEDYYDKHLAELANRSSLDGDGICAVPTGGLAATDQSSESAFSIHECVEGEIAAPDRFDFRGRHLLN